MGFGRRIQFSDVGNSLGVFGLPSELPPLREESQEDNQRRFEIECEFVQSLANPHYVNCKAKTCVQLL